MGCCGKTFRQGAAIVTGYSRLAAEKLKLVPKCPYTDDRIRVCQRCPYKNPKKWARRSLWCTICSCYIPAKARQDWFRCPKGFWQR